MSIISIHYQKKEKEKKDAFFVDFEHTIMIYLDLPRFAFESVGYENMSRHQRICVQCNWHEIEDKFHHIFSCNSLQLVQMQYL